MVQHQWLELMVKCIIAMMGWRHIPMNPFTHLGILAEELLPFPTEISMNELSLLALVGQSELGMLHFVGSSIRISFKTIFL